MVWRIVGGSRAFKQAALQGAADRINRIVPRRLPLAQNRIRRFANDFLRGTLTYKSLVGGTSEDEPLRGHFGFPKGTERVKVDGVINKLVSGIELRYTPIGIFSGRFRGGIRIVLPIERVRETLEDDLASFGTENNFIIRWLEWLIVRGDEVVISSHHVVFRDGLKSSRSGIAIMGKGGLWKVPSEYSGTINNNWFTRAMKDQQAFIDAVSGILTTEFIR